MTYESIAARVGVRLCPGGDAFNHDRGQYDWITGIIHWAPRRVTKPGLRNFLKLVARAQLGTDNVKEPLKTYLESGWADGLARDLGVRFPRHYRTLDKARVKAALPGARRFLEEDTWRAIRRWTR